MSAGPEEFPIPRVVGLSEEAARSLIIEQGFVVGEVTSRFTTDVDEGLVIEQDPDSGDVAPPRTAIDLVLSGGPFALTVPDVTNATRDAAVSQLRAEGFEVTVEEEFSDDILEGFVVRTDPGAGQLVGREDPRVTVFVSEGPEPFALPNFVGRSLNEARSLANELGLQLVEGNAVEVSLASGLAGRVAEQTPAPNSEVTINDTVEVRLGVLRQVEVPDLTGLGEAQAQALLRGLGLDLFVIGEVAVDPDSGLVGRVAGQDPPAEAIVPEGTIVEVQLGAAAAPPGTTTTTLAPSP